MHPTHYAKQALIIGSLLLTACGGGGGSTETNTAPIVTDINITTNEDTPKSFTLSGTDIDGDTLTYTITQDPSHGTISGDTYTPEANYHGTDSFKFKACDTSNACSAEATVDITITSLNDAPVATAQTLTTSEDTPKSFTLSGSDADGDTLTYIITQDPSHGTISGDTYTPEENYHGTDNFKFKACDTSNACSAEATVDITITSVNDNPTIQSIADITKDEDFTDDLKIDIDASDIDGNTLSYSVSISNSSLINTSISGDTLSITPQPNANGTTTVTVIVDDGNGGSASTSFTVTLTPVNDAPIIQTEITIPEDTEITKIKDYISDPENDSFTYEVTAYPAHGYIYYSTYHPAQNYYGTDSYTIQACDSSNACSTQEVTITITPVNDAPFAYNSHYKSPSHQSVTVELNATDVDGDDLTYVIDTDDIKHGTYDPETKTYTPESNYTGVDYFSYTATDPDGLSSTGRVYITVGDTQAPYITIWDTSITHYENPTVSSWSYDSNTSATQLKIGANPDETYNFTIDWGDGQIDSNVTQTITHDYGTEGNYTVIISGDYPHSWMGDGSTDENYKHYDAMKLRSIEQWGDQQWNAMRYAYFKAHTMQMHAADEPDLSSVADMCSMFSGASSFNQPLESWDVSNVTSIGSMFSGASSFNQPLESWDVSSVADMHFMFYEASSFNQPLESWNVSSVADMGSMFYRATSFNQPLESWNVSSVADMHFMFYEASSFNQPLESWNVSSVTNMYAMFYIASLFNQPLNDWNVSSVTDMGYMFRGATSFNQPLNDWNVSSVTNMTYMFLGATSFNQDISIWNVTAIEKTGDYNWQKGMYGMLDDTALSTANYDKLLNAWSQQAIHNDITLGAAGLTYSSDATDARAKLIKDFNWTIEGDMQE